MSTDSTSPRGGQLATTRSSGGGFFRGALRLAGYAAGTAIRSGQAVVGASVEAGREIVNVVASAESAVDLAGKAGTAIRDLMQNAMGVTEESVREIVSYVPVPSLDGNYLAIPAHSTSLEELRVRGDALLAKSANVYRDESVHPAYDRILDELAPDEARILRFLAQKGVQPALDVRTNRPLGKGSELVEGNLNTIAQQAGCRHQERGGRYLTNLTRLGLVAVSSDPVVLSRYQVLEVQPHVTDAIKRGGWAPKMVKKSIKLTDLGTDFCNTCFSIRNGESRPDADKAEE